MASTTRSWTLITAACRAATPCSRHRSRRHRQMVVERQLGAQGVEPPRPGEVPGEDLGMEGTVRRQHHPADSSPGLLGGLVARALMVVERQLGAQGVSRHDLGREKFLEKIWEWKEQSGGNITRQIRRLGSSVDWSRERFTMDDGLSEAVKEAFVRLHEDGLIYRGKRLVNWDAAHRDFRPGSGKPRREGPPLAPALPAGERREDQRHHPSGNPAGRRRGRGAPGRRALRKLIGQFAELPIVGRHIPIIADEYVDREFGTGCVKITPAHDFNDYEVGKRHDLPLINIFDKNAAVLAQAQVFHLDGSVNPNLDPSRRRATPAWTASPRARPSSPSSRPWALEKVDDHALKVPKGDRSGTVIEPWLTDQWYVSTAAGRRRHRRRGRRPYPVRAQAVREHVLLLDARHPGLHQPPALVGPPHPGLVRRGRQRLRRPRRGRGAHQAQARQRGRVAPGRRRSRHLVQLRPMDLLHPRLAAADRVPQDLPPHRRTGHRLRHHLLLGRADDHAHHAPGEEPRRHPADPVQDRHVHGLVRDGQGQKMSKSRATYSTRWTSSTASTSIPCCKSAPAA